MSSSSTSKSASLYSFSTIDNNDNTTTKNNKDNDDTHSLRRLLSGETLRDVKMPSRNHKSNLGERPSDVLGKIVYDYKEGQEYYRRYHPKKSDGSKSNK